MYLYELLSTRSAATSVTTSPMDLGDLQVYAIGVTFTGADVTGTLKLQCSIDNVTYYDVTGSTQSVVTSMNHLWNVWESSYRYVKASWTYSSGTGNITIISIIKENVVKGF